MHDLHEARAGLADRGDHLPFENRQDVVLDDDHRRSAIADVGSSPVSATGVVGADPVPATLGDDDARETVAQLPPWPSHDIDRFPHAAPSSSAHASVVWAIPP